MNSPTDAAADSVSERLARLTPQQRALLARQVAGRAVPALTAEPAADTAIQRRDDIGAPLPLSPAQQRIWFFERLQPGTGAYHVSAHYRLRGEVDAAALQGAFAQIVQRHESLRTAFDEVSGVPRQRVVPAVDFAMEVIDLQHLPETGRDAEARRLANDEADRPFDLSRAPLLRASLFRSDNDQHDLVVVMHHIVSDAWSSGVLFGELMPLYNALRAGGHAEPASLPVQFPDVVLWQREPAQASRAESHLRFWTHALQGTTGLLDLPTDQPRSTAPLGRGGCHEVKLPASVVDAFAELARQQGATLFMAMLAAFQALLARHSGQEDIVIGTPVANRGMAESEPLIGLFVNTLPLRGDLSGDPSFRELLTRTRAHCLDALEHSEAPLERIVDELRMERVPGRTPLFQTMFVLQNASSVALDLHGASAEWIEARLHTARFDLTLSLGAGSSGMAGVLDYNQDLFDADTVARMAAQYEALLRGVVADPDRPLSRIDILDTAQQSQLLQLGDGGTPAQESQASLFELFATQAALTPEAIALVEPGRELSYSQLLQRACGVAQRLHELGVRPESRVAVLTDRSIESIIAVLGVLAAGGAYVPLDPAHPDDRLNFLLTDAAVEVLVTPSAWLARAGALGSAVAVVVTDESDGAMQAPVSGVGERNAAYVIYTSGSTGAPKGVVVEHRGAVNLVRGFMARHDFRAQRLLMIPPLVFDASVGDVFPVLASGSTLVLHPTPTELGPQELERFCRENRVTAIDAPAALWRRWSDGWAASARNTPLLPELQLMMIGGESVPLDQVRRFSAATDGRVDLCNHYGPTEASVCATLLSTRDASELSGDEFSIGRPLPGVRIYLVDRHLQLAPRGVVGELCIGGLGVARGYLGQPELTAASFVPDDFAECGARLYRTGDLARWTGDGTLQFLGRRDHQTKLRGFRIELGEIESALASHPDIETAVVVVREDRPGDRRLVAYVVAPARPATADLRAHLATRLPDALVPNVFVRLDALPLTSNGKVDRRALPAPSDDEAAPRVIREATTDTERAVLAVWADVLGRDDLGIDDDFFAVGGDSLLTLSLVFKLHKAMGVELPLATIFAAPTAVAMARAINALRAGVAVEAFDLQAQVQLPPEIHPRNARLPAAARAAPRSVLVTGATGFLGAYLVRELLDTTAAEILCLVRADSVPDGLRRVQQNLETYGLWRAGDQERLVPVPGDLSTPLLGLAAEEFTALALRAEVIFHNGGQVNFLAPYQHLEAANVLGTREVLRLATSERIKPVHLVSTLGVHLVESNLGRTVRESDPAPEASGQHGGYNQSKWVSEQLALLARSRGLPVAVYRPARITGDSRTGACNLGDYFNAWLKGCVQLGLAPHLPDESFDMAPVDYVGRSIVRLALGAGEANGNFHFFNPNCLPMTAAVAALRDAGYPLREVPYAQWRAALLADAAVSRDNALALFSGLFPEQPDAREPKFDCSATASAVAAFGLECPPADAALFAVYLRFLQSRGFLPVTVEEDA